MPVSRDKLGSSSSIQALLAELKECTRLRNLQRGKEAHARAVECGHDSNIHVAAACISMYAKCGSMADAHHLFDKTKHPNLVAWNALILGYADHGQGLRALDLFKQRHSRGVSPDAVTFVAALKACTSLAERGASSEQCRQWGKEIYDLAVECGCHLYIYVQNTLIDMHAKCGCLAEARQAFDNIECPDVVSWNTLILGYAENGQCLAGLDLFRRMKREGPAPDCVTFLAVLKACTFLAAKRGACSWSECREWGKEIHELAVKSGCDSVVKVQNTLIDMYSNCGSIADARLVFDRLKHPSVVSWNALILGYAENGQGLVALDLFARMKSEGPAPDSITFLAVLRACTFLASSGCAECSWRGREIHDFAVQNGCASNFKVQNSLIGMYAKCGRMADAQQVFDSIKYPSVISWSTLILGYADNGQGPIALDLYMKMKLEGPAPDAITFAPVLKACGLVGGLEFGRTVHSEIHSSELDEVVVTCLVDFYARCGSLVEAQSVFNLHSESRDVRTWTALLAGFSCVGDHESLFRKFQEMQDAGVLPDSVTFLCILTCCSHQGLVEKGKQCFDAMCTKHRVIPSVEHYTCIADIFGRANKLDEAMALLKGMPCSPDYVTWTAVLGACRKSKVVELGRLAFQALVSLNEQDGAAYVLMGQVYESRGMLQEQAMVMGMKRELKALRKPGQTCWTNELGEVHSFFG